MRTANRRCVNWRCHDRIPAGLLCPSCRLMAIMGGQVGTFLGLSAWAIWEAAKLWYALETLSR